MQSELQALKQRIEGGGPSSEQQQHLFSLERHAVVTKVQQLKNDFSRLLQELRRKQSPSTTHAVVSEVRSLCSLALDIEGRQMITMVCVLAVLVVSKCKTGRRYTGLR